MLYIIYLTFFTLTILTSVSVIDGEEGSVRIVGQREDVRVGVLHVDAPALHAAGAHAELRVLARGRLLGRHGLGQSLAHGLAPSDCRHCQHPTDIAHTTYTCTHNTVTQHIQHDICTVQSTQDAVYCLL